MPPSNKPNGGPTAVVLDLEKNGFAGKEKQIDGSLCNKVILSSQDPTLYGSGGGRAVLPGLGAAIFYAVCSSSMAFVNKAVMSTYHFRYPFFVMSTQMLLTVVFLEVLRLTYRKRSSEVEACQKEKAPILEPYTLQQGWMFLTPTLLYAINAVTALTALSGMTIPMYTAMKRCSPLVTLILGILVLHRPVPNVRIIVAVLLISIGCILAGLGDMEFNKVAYCYGVVSVITQSLYLTLVQRGAENNMTTLQVLQLNSFNNLPLFTFAFFFSNEAHEVIDYFLTRELGPVFLLCLFGQIAAGAVLNYSLFLCTMLNSALTTSLVGVFKSLVTTIVGFFTFGGVAFHPLNVAGIGLNAYGGVLYSVTKYQEQKKAGQTSKASAANGALATSPSQVALPPSSSLSLVFSRIKMAAISIFFPFTYFKTKSWRI